MSTTKGMSLQENRDQLYIECIEALAQYRVWKVEEVAMFLKVHRSSIYRLLRANPPPGAFRIGADWRFNVNLFLGWVREASAQKPSPVTGESK